MDLSYCLMSVIKLLLYLSILYKSLIVSLCTSIFGSWSTVHISYSAGINVFINSCWYTLYIRDDYLNVLFEYFVLLYDCFDANDCHDRIVLGWSMFMFGSSAFDFSMFSVWRFNDSILFLGASSSNSSFFLVLNCMLLGFVFHIITGYLWNVLQVLHVLLTLPKWINGSFFIGRYVFPVSMYSQNFEVQCYNSEQEIEYRLWTGTSINY